MAGTVSLRTLLIFISGQNVYKTQTSLEALRRSLSAYIFTQQLIRKTSEIIACLSLLGGVVKRSGLSYDSPPFLNNTVDFFTRPIFILPTSQNRHSSTPTFSRYKSNPIRILIGESYGRTTGWIRFWTNPIAS